MITLAGRLDASERKKRAQQRRDRRTVLELNHRMAAKKWQYLPGWVEWRIARVAARQCPCTCHYNRPLPIAGHLPDETCDCKGERYGERAYAVHLV